jgi:penicillin-binding protein 1A
VVQGGSTITQQLAKRLFTTGKRNLARKALEAVMAFQIEKKFSKNEILEMYLNQIFLGHGCYGISTASEFFFDKKVKHLSVIEGSVLAALPSNPIGFSPLRNPRAAYSKNRDTLRRMVSAGFISREEADRMYDDFWPQFIDSLKTEFPTKNAFTKSDDKAPFFTDYVRQILLSRFGKDVVYNEGLNVYTTLDLKRQMVAQKYLEQGLARQNIVSAQSNAMYNSALDRSLISAYSQLRLVFGLPGFVVKNDIETILRKQMAEDDVDSMDALSLLLDVPSMNHCIQSFREVISGISTSLKVEGAFLAIEPATGYISSMVGGSEYAVTTS